MIDISWEPTHEWRWPGAAKKAHIFPRKEMRAICGGWLLAQDMPDDTVKPAPITRGRDDCAVCVKRYNKLGAGGESKSDSGEGRR